MSMAYLKKFFFFFWVYIYPFPALIVFYQYWQARLNQDFALWMLIVPSLYGYIIPGIAVNFMKKWKFNTKFKLGRYYAHHGFKYAANMNTWFFLASFHVDIAHLTFPMTLTLAITTGATHAFITWWHDTHLLKMGKLEIYNVLVNPSMSAEEKSFSYAPTSFFVLGTSFALAAIYYFQKYSIEDTTNLQRDITLGFLFIATTSSVVFWLLEERARQKLYTTYRAK
jgi:hypothetical protein